MGLAVDGKTDEQRASGPVEGRVFLRGRLSKSYLGRTGIDARNCIHVLLSRERLRDSGERIDT